MEEWAFLILKPNVIQGRVSDNKNWTREARMLKGQPKFIISNIDFTKDSNLTTDKSKAASLTTHATGLNNMQKKRVGTEFQQVNYQPGHKSRQKILWQQEISDKETGCVKLLYDAASSLTALVNKFYDNIKNKDLNEMHQ